MSMRGAHHESVLRQLGQVFEGGSASGLSDEELLARSCGRHDEAAFEALVRRHGPMIWGVCRRLLRDPHDAEDAFQATFLILLRKAGTLRDPGALGPWLYGVAYRVALRARANAALRREREPLGARGEALTIPEETDEQDRARLVLDEEIRRLPRKDLKPLVLCYLQGLTYEEAARRLNWSPTTFKGRLSRARERLRTQLTRRGLGSSLGLVGVNSLWEPTSVAVPSALVTATTRLIPHASAIGLAAEVKVSTTILTLVEGAIQAMRLSRIKAASISLALVVTTTLMTLAYASAQNGRDEPDTLVVQPLVVAKKDEPKDQPKPVQPGQTLKVRVVDRSTGQAIPDVQMRIWQEGRRHDEVTNTSGDYLIKFAETKATWLSLRVNKAGYVPIIQNWLGSINVPSIDLPSSLEIALERGTRIGGVIRNSEGKPIERVQVFLRVSGKEYDPDGNSPRAALDDYPVETDAQGRWICDYAPATLVGLSIKLRHPDYVSDNLQYRKAPPLRALRDLSSVMVMAPGVTVSGRVLDHENKPIAKATVNQGSGHGASHPSVKTDNHGHFSFVHVAPGDLPINVQAPGFAHELRDIKVSASMAPIEVHLEKGRDIQGHVRDQAGKPIQGASVSVMEFPKPWNIWSSAKTDTEGRFLFLNEPSSTLTFRVYKPGYVVVDQTVVAESLDPLIILIPELRLQGSVVDSETNQPIHAFRLTIGDNSKAEPARWDRLRTYHRGNGRYEVGLPNLRPERVSLLIEADGYQPAVSREFRSTEGTQIYDFKLIRGSVPADPKLSGIVRHPDGSPVEGATVVLSMKSLNAYFKDGQIREPERNPNMKTGRDGAFAFPQQAEPAIILVEHEKGYALLPQEKVPESRVIELIPWSRVEGTLAIGSRPGALQKVRLAHGFLGMQDDPRTRESDSETETNASGLFTFERVMSGVTRITRMTEIMLGGLGMGPWVSIETKPGEMATVKVGGTGRPFVGRIVKVAGSDFNAETHSPSLRIHLGLKHPRPNIEIPQGLTQEKKAEWVETWRHSPAGIAYAQERNRAQCASYPVKIEADGSFRIEDVTPNTYRWLIYHLEPGSRNLKIWSMAPETVVVPEMDGERSEQPLNVGDLEIIAKAPAAL